MLVFGSVAVLAIVGVGVLERDSWLPELLTILCVVPLLYVSWRIGLWLTRRFLHFGNSAWET
jgi:hypothetical protein